jgi:D-aminoacyl-tRNA deacylase
VSETWIRAVSGVDLDVVSSCTERLCSVDDGLRFGKPASGRTSLPDDATVTSLPEDLLAEVAGIDLESTRRAVAEHALAFETMEAGARPRGPILVARPAVESAIVDALAAVLDAKYDSVEREDDAILAERSVFDPDRAATLGVPEGPAFGRLAAGESVTVDDREIDPDVVASTERRRFPL